MLPGSRRRRLSWTLTTGVVASSAALYVAASNERVAARFRALRERASAMFHAGCLLVNAFTCSAETVNRVAEDFNAFMVKDEESETGRAAEQPPSTLPPSLRKLLHILQSPEAALAAGNLVRGALGLAPSPAGAPTSLLESALGALGSEKGQTLLTCVVGRAAREAMGSLVDAVFANLQSSFASDAGLDRVLHDVFAALDAPHARGLLLDALSALVSAAVSSYIEKTASMHINVADTLITSMMKPDHRSAVQQMMGHMSREVVTTILSSPSASHVPPPSPPPANRRARGSRAASRPDVARTLGFDDPACATGGSLAGPSGGVSPSPPFPSGSTVAHGSGIDWPDASQPSARNSAGVGHATADVGQALVRKNSGVAGAIAAAAGSRGNFGSTGNLLAQQGMARLGPGASQAGWAGEIVQYMVSQPEARALLKEVAVASVREAVSTTLGYFNPLQWRVFARRAGAMAGAAGRAQEVALRGATGRGGRARVDEAGWEAGDGERAVEVSGKGRGRLAASAEAGPRGEVGEADRETRKRVAVVPSRWGSRLWGPFEQAMLGSLMRIGLG